MRVILQTRGNVSSTGLKPLVSQQANILAHSRWFYRQRWSMQITRTGDCCLHSRLFTLISLLKFYLLLTHTQVSYTSAEVAVSKLSTTLYLNGQYQCTYKHFQLLSQIKGKF